MTMSECSDVMIVSSWVFSVTLIILLPREIDDLCDYMASHYPGTKPIRCTCLLGQSYTRKFKQKIKDCLGGIVLVNDCCLICVFKRLMTCIIKLKLNWLLREWILLHLEVLNYCATLLQSQNKSAQPRSNII